MSSHNASFRESANKLLHQVQSSIENTEEHIANAYATTKKSVVAGAKATDRTIRSHPYESAAVAFGIGVLVGILIARERD